MVNYICYTCDIQFVMSQLSFMLYQCFRCKQKTPFCNRCIPVITKLFGPLIFKCMFCNSISNVFNKEKVVQRTCNSFPSFQRSNVIQMNRYVNPFCVDVFGSDKQKEEFNDEFNNKLSISNYSCSNEQGMLLNKKRSHDVCAVNAGNNVNKVNNINNNNVKVKHYVTNVKVSNSDDVSNIFSSAALKKLTFNKTIDEFGNRKHIPPFGTHAANLEGYFDNNNNNNNYQYNHHFTSTF